MWKVSCMVRAGWSGRKFNASKLKCSVSTSGPSATSQPIATNTFETCSEMIVIGCRAPAGRRLAGRVTSIASATRTAASRSACSCAFRSSNAVCTTVRCALTRLPASARSLPGSEPSARFASEMGALSPRCSIFACASASRSGAAVNASCAAFSAATSASSVSALGSTAGGVPPSFLATTGATPSSGERFSRVPPDPGSTTHKS
jgi:hypothetical protein